MKSLIQILILLLLLFSSQLQESFTQETKVMNSSACATITGRVQENYYGTITGGEVYALLVDSMYSQNPVVAKASFFRSGWYTLEIQEPGKYILKVTGPEFFAEYYKDTTNIAGAQRIDIKCGDNLQIDFKVKGRPFHTIRGTVTSKSTQQRVVATIYFIQEDGNIYDTASTASSGNYEKRIPGAVSFLLKAVPWTSGYLTQYYDRVDDIISATPVSLTATRNNVNFILNSRPSYNNGVRGTVWIQAGKGVMAHVTAYHLSDDHQSLNSDFAATVQTDANGAFVIQNFIPGDYVFYIKPWTGSYLPGYYKTNSALVQSWQSATIITLADSGFVNDLDIFVSNFTSGQGSAKFRGVVNVKVSGIDGSGNPIFIDVPVAGAMIYLFNDQNKCVDFGFSDGKGNFELSKANAGNYTVNIDKVGFFQYQSDVKFDDSNSVVEKTIELKPLKPMVDVKHDNDFISLKKFDVEIYPNPASSFTNVRLGSVYGDVRIHVFNLLGLEVYSEDVLNIKGMNYHTLDLSRFRNGLYIVQIYTPASISSGFLTVIR